MMDDTEIDAALDRDGQVEIPCEGRRMLIIDLGHPGHPGLLGTDILCSARGRHVAFRDLGPSPEPNT